MNKQDILRVKLQKILEEEGLKRVVQLHGVDEDSTSNVYYRIWVGNYSLVWSFSKEAETKFLNNKKAFVSTLLKSSLVTNWVEDSQIWN